MKLRIWIFLAFVLLPQFIYGQTDVPLKSSDDYNDVILLKNGAEITGKIIETQPQKKVIIERRDGSILEVPFKKIEVITTTDKISDIKDRIREAESQSGFKSLRTEFKNHTRVGFLSGEDETIFSVSSVNGVLIEDIVYLGIGVGWDNYPHASFVPLFVEILRYVHVDRFSTYLVADAGYAFGFIDNLIGQRGGLTTEVGVGTQYAFDRKNVLSGQIAYKIQKSKVYGNLNFLAVKIGYRF